MRPFNLDEYLDNPSKKLVTRDGHDARIICTDAINGSRPIIALVKLSNSAYGEIGYYYNVDGMSEPGKDSPEDLFFAPEKHEGWLNIYHSESGFYLRGNPYKSKEEADEVAKANYKTFCTTVKIEWEE